MLWIDRSRSGETLGKRQFAAAGLALAGFMLGSCASPGVPRAPSLRLPAVVTGLAAVRQGDDVELRFTLPQRTTDDLPIRSTSVRATVCRAIDRGACVALTSESFNLLTNGQPTVAVVRDALAGPLTTGAPRLLAYRVALFNERGRTAGFSEAAYAAAGAAPPAVQGLSAEGSRAGIVLRWLPAGSDAGDVVLRREDIGTAPGTAPGGPGIKPSRTDAKRVRRATQSPTRPGAKAAASAASEMPNVVWLATSGAQGPFAAEMPEQPVSAGTAAEAPRDLVLDATALAGDPYRYTAERRRQVRLGRQTLEMCSAPSEPVSFVLRMIYPPEAPTDLSAASFMLDNGAQAVDLIWQPVEDTGLAGYKVYRQALNAAGATVGAMVRLNAKPVALPAFHDVLPAPASDVASYRYQVTAVDDKGNESGAAVTSVHIQQQ